MYAFVGAVHWSGSLPLASKCRRSFLRSPSPSTAAKKGTPRSRVERGEKVSAISESRPPPGSSGMAISTRPADPSSLHYTGFPKAEDGWYSGTAVVVAAMRHPSAARCHNVTFTSTNGPVGLTGPCSMPTTEPTVDLRGLISCAEHPEYYTFLAAVRVVFSGSFRPTTTVRLTFSQTSAGPDKYGPGGIGTNLFLVHRPWAAANAQAGKYTHDGQGV